MLGKWVGNRIKYFNRKRVCKDDEAWPVTHGTMQFKKNNFLRNWGQNLVVQRIRTSLALTEPSEAVLTKARAVPEPELPPRPDPPQPTGRAATLVSAAGERLLLMRPEFPELGFNSLKM